MGDDIRKKLVPGAKVRIIQQIPHRNRVWTNEVRGVIVAYGQRPTGSWYAHGKGDKLWLDRLVIRKPDNEITTLNLDEYSRVEIEPAESPQAVAANP